MRREELLQKENQLLKQKDSQNKGQSKAFKEAD